MRSTTLLLRPGLRDGIRQALLEVFQLRLAPWEIGDEELLFGESLPALSEKLLELVGKLEEAFGIQLPDEALNREFFISVEAIAATMEATLSDSGRRESP